MITQKAEVEELLPAVAKYLAERGLAKDVPLSVAPLLGTEGKYCIKMLYASENVEEWRKIGHSILGVIIVVAIEGDDE